MRTRDVKVYFPEGLLDWWTKFVEICDREGSSASEKVREWVIDYVQKHGHGNPQTLLDRYQTSRHARTAMSVDEDLWPEMPCKLRNPWGRCQVLLEPCSRAICPRENPRTKSFLEDLT